MTVNAQKHTRGFVIWVKVKFGRSHPVSGFLGQVPLLPSKKTPPGVTFDGVVWLVPASEWMC